MPYWEAMELILMIFPFAAGQHGLYHFPRKGEYDLYVGMEDMVELFVGHIPEILFHIDPGVIDEDIDMTKAGNDLPDQAGQGRKVVQVVGDRMAIVSQLLLGGGQLVCVAADDDRPDACFDEAVGDCQADTGAAAGDDRCSFRFH